jgi:hypothetical protein
MSGTTTGKVEKKGPEPAGNEELLRGKLAEKNRRLTKLRGRLEEKDREIAGLRGLLARRDAGAEVGGPRPENIVWIFGAARSGSTWLAAMMADVEGQTMWHEPLVGTLFGNLYYVRGSEAHRRSPNFILGRHREAWLGSIRSFVLDGAAARFPEVADGGYLVIKEPNGSIGAPLLMQALPESRMILLVRDPRDVVASNIDALRRGSWREGRTDRVGEQPDLTTEERANAYAQHVGNARTAYDAHEGHKVLIKYEDLRADTLTVMRRIFSELAIPVREVELARVVEGHSWENIPEEDKGEGKFYRKATPGSWREDLTDEQAQVVERITAPLLDEFYPGWRKRQTGE